MMADLVKGEQGPRALEAVASELQLLQRVDVLHQELGGRPRRHLGHPAAPAIDK